MIRRDAAYVAEVVGKSPNWVRRNAPRLPHHKAGKTYFWTDEDVADLLEQMKRRPGVPVEDQSLRPITGRRAS